MRVPLFVSVLVSVVAGARAQDAAAKPAIPIPPELTKALAKATAHNQRVLAILADDARDLQAAMKKDRVLSRPLLYEFEVATLQGDAAHALAVQWKLPDALHERPTLVVLDQTGKPLASVAPAQFLDDGKLQGDKLLPLLQPHYCPPIDAEKKLAASLAEAKKSGRHVLVRFDAPW